MDSSKRSAVVARIKAFAVDYLVILAYIGLLFGVTMGISNLFGISLGKVSNATGQLIGSFTLTLPVILYFSLTEAGNYAGSIGKRRFSLKVVSLNSGKAGFSKTFLRNLIKFLPWEIAHFFVFQLFHFLRTNTEPPGWVLSGLIIAQGLAVIYFLFLLFNKDNRAPYELISSTKVIRVPPPIS